MRISDGISDVGSSDLLSNLKTIVDGGAPMYLEDVKRALDVLGPKLVQIYGQGEAPMTITGLPRHVYLYRGHPRWEQRIGATGVPRTDVEVRVVDEHGHALPAGEPGEVICRGQTTEQVANASITGQLGEYGVRSPFATTGVGVNVGVEYRREELTLTPDSTFLRGDLAGIGGATLPIDGSFDVKEAFAETRIPLVEDRPFFRSLGVELGYRRSQYAVQGNDFGTDTFKIAGDWTPVEGIRLRGGFNRAVRAPNIVELYAQQRTGLGGTSDPCTGAAVNGRVNGYTRSEEHTSELQSLMRISYAVFCL